MSLVTDGIRRIFEDIFTIEVGEEDGFFDLGGDSLAGETLLAGIERDFGVSLPLSILLETSTPRALADAIMSRKKEAQPKILYTVSDTGSGTPLICIHGSTGTAAFSRKLRDVLPDRPIYAVRVLGLLPGEVPLISVPEMARSYIREIRQVRPSGPYHIFGQCMTAQVAYEVAQQLSAEGDRVKTVTLGDPFRLKRRSRLRRLYYWLAGQRAISTARRLPQLTGKERKQKVLRPARLAAIKTYETRPYSGRMLIVAASNNVDELLHPERGYPALVPHLETIIVKGKHRDVFTRMDPSSPGKLARAISSFLARHD
ncbi:MAG: thioesterase domain-containing protein [Hyphomicrobiales bacterium]|nr:thioesterase domain-containing protein [Hyphomicrobiales bacterium]